MKNAILRKIILIATIELRLKIGSIKFEKKKKDKKMKTKRYNYIYQIIVMYLRKQYHIYKNIVFADKLLYFKG